MFQNFTSNVKFRFLEIPERGISLLEIRWNAGVLWKFVAFDIKEFYLSVKEFLSKNAIILLNNTPKYSKKTKQ